jgi:hypothetical protein
MVFTVSVRYGWTRRAVFVATAGAGATGILSGCSWFDTTPVPPPPDPLEPLLGSTRDLAARYAAVLAARPELADRLGPLLAAHQAHAETLAGMVGRPGSAASAAAAWSPPQDPGQDPEQLLLGLREVELTAREEAAAACLAAPPDRASVLGSITAARATHAEVLA